MEGGVHRMLIGHLGLADWPADYPSAIWQGNSGRRRKPARVVA